MPEQRISDSRLVGSTGATNRYSRMERVAQLRHVDPGRLHERSALVVGCGALGSAVAMQLVRAGVGRVRIVDRDLVEQRNLVDQILFSENDAANLRPKAEAAASALKGFNSESAIEGVLADFAPGNARELVAGADVIIDGVDNLEAKLLINDVAVATRTPYVYGGCAGSEGAVLAVLPGRTHCLRCLWATPGYAVLGCETAGVLPGVVAAIAALQFTEALKILLGLEDEVFGALVRVDIWAAAVHRVPLPRFHGGARPCPACEQGDLAYLDGRQGTTVSQLCGDDTVLISMRGNGAPDLVRLSERRRNDPSIRVAPECVRFQAEGCQFLVFANGNALIHGSGTALRAKALYARYVAV